MTTLHIDFETRSVVDLKKSGVYVYAEHADTDVTCAAYAFGDGPVRLWKRSEACPHLISEHVKNGGEIAAWNAAFERIIWWSVLSHRGDWPRPRLEQFRCVMVQAMAMALPASLEMGAAALGITNQKDMQGSRLAIQMSKPRRMEGARPIWWDDAERLEKLYAYCKQDVEVEREADGRLVPLKASERELWLLDQRINDRGVKVDISLCKQSAKVVAQATAKLDKELSSVTGGDVTGVSQAAGLIKWLNAQGVETESVGKDRLVDLLGLELKPHVRRALEIRREGAKSSTAKINALLNCVNRDGRARGLLQFHGASTGRWAGRRFQPQNLKRPDMKNPESAVPALMTGDAEFVEAIYDNPLSVVSDCTRSMLRAEPAKRLKSADFANIEGRVLAWLAGEIWKIKAFRDYDNKTGPDLYKVAAGGIFGVQHDAIGKDDKRRQIGKVSELSMGYEGGVGAFVTMAPNYQLRIADHYDAVVNGVSREFVDAAREKFAKDKALEKRWGERTYVPAESIKLAWRAKHPKTVATWKETKEAAIEAVGSPGKTTVCCHGLVKYRVAGSFLWCQLPSGRTLCYPYPSLKDVKAPWGAMVPSLRFKGVDSYTRKWGDQGTYGGSLIENIVQAIARDLMGEAMLRVDAAYPLVLTVHDELLSESDNEAPLSEYEKLMAELPPWAAGCPVTAEGWVGERYRK